VHNLHACLKQAPWPTQTCTHTHARTLTPLARGHGFSHPAQQHATRANTEPTPRPVCLGLRHNALDSTAHATATMSKPSSKPCQNWHSCRPKASQISRYSRSWFIECFLSCAAGCAEPGRGQCATGALRNRGCRNRGCRPHIVSRGDTEAYRSQPGVHISC
jgi:hypothetical protein